MAGKGYGWCVRWWYRFLGYDPQVVQNTCNLILGSCHSHIEWYRRAGNVMFSLGIYECRGGRVKLWCLSFDAWVLTDWPSYCRWKNTQRSLFRWRLSTTKLLQSDLILILHQFLFLGNEHLILYYSIYMSLHLLLDGETKSLMAYHIKIHFFFILHFL